MHLMDMHECNVSLLWKPLDTHNEMDFLAIEFYIGISFDCFLDAPFR